MKNNIRKSVRRWLALAMTIAMLFTMATTVMAADSGLGGSYSISITNGSGNTYSLYQIATYDVETLDSKTVYTNIDVNSDYSNIITDNNLETVAGYGATDAAALAVTLKEAASATTLVASGVTDGEISGLVTGYYLLVETAHSTTDASTATQYCLINVDGLDDQGNVSATETVTLKNSTPTLTKKIILESDATDQTLVDANVAAAGDTVRYQIDTVIPTYSSDATDLVFTITDTLSDGLEYKEVESVTVGGGAVTEAADTYSVEHSNGVVTIAFASDYIKAHYGEAVVVKLSATLTGSNVNIGEDGNPNSAKLTYTNNWVDNSTSKTEEDSVITYVGELQIFKIDYDTKDTTKEPLSGAVFAIYGTDATKAKTPATGIETTISPDKVITYYYYGTTNATDASGLTSYSGLDQGTYYAVEITAPAGYSVDSTPVELTVTVTAKNTSSVTLDLETEGEKVSTSGNDNTETEYKATWTTNGNVSGTITNKKGLTMPGTGGIGTTLFTFGGLALVILAAIMFIAYTKKQRKQA